MLNCRIVSNLHNQKFSWERKKTVILTQEHFLCKLAIKKDLFEYKADEKFTSFALCAKCTRITLPVVYFYNPCVQGQTTLFRQYIVTQFTMLMFLYYSQRSFV